MNYNEIIELFSKQKVAKQLIKKRKFRNKIMEASSTTVETFMWLASKYPKHVAQHPNTPKEVLQKLAEHENDDVRYCVACNTKCPNDILEILAKDKNWDIVEKVVAHENFKDVSIETLKFLIIHPVSLIRSRVARKKNFAEFILTQFANDLDSHVRKRVAQNPYTPKDVVKKLAEDKDDDVKKIAEQRLNKK